MLPLTINYETRWLETVTIECRYKEYFYDCWVPIRFLDNMEEKTSEKTQIFFVSNSSSSSFVVVLPNDFKLEQYVDEKVLEYVSTEDVDSLINDFQTQFNASEELPLEIYQYDDGDIFDVFIIYLNLS